LHNFFLNCYHSRHFPAKIPPNFPAKLPSKNAGAMFGGVTGQHTKHAVWDTVWGCNLMGDCDTEPQAVLIPYVLYFSP